MPGPEIPHAISSRLNIQEIIHNSAKQWDGGYAIMGAIGNGDYFCLRDPHGIRPCHYLITDEFIAVASERVPLMTVLKWKANRFKNFRRPTCSLSRQTAHMPLRNLPHL